MVQKQTQDEEIALQILNLQKRSVFSRKTDIIPVLLSAISSKYVELIFKIFILSLLNLKTFFSTNVKYSLFYLYAYGIMLK